LKKLKFILKSVEEIQNSLKSVEGNPNFVKKSVEESQISLKSVGEIKI